MTAPDLLCLALIAGWLVFDHFVVWRLFLRRLQADSNRARLWLYPVLVGQFWTVVAGVVLLWLYQGRDWSLLRLNAPHGWQLWISLALVLVLATALAYTIVSVVRLQRRKRVKVRSEGTAHAPHNQRELAWWAAVSLSAGFAEELIFRGYLIWAFQPLFGLWGAAAFSLAVFTVAHGYHGVRGALAVGAVGGLLTLVVLIFNSLWPAVVMHLLLDLQQGINAWLLLRKLPEQNKQEIP